LLAKSFVVRLYLHTLRHAATHFTLQHTVTHGNTRQHVAPFCTKLHNTAPHCNTNLRFLAKSFVARLYFNTLQHAATHLTLKHTATHCNTLHQPKHTATHCNTPRLCLEIPFRKIFSEALPYHIANGCTHTKTHCIALQHTATHCNTLQYTATHCNTLHHIAPYCITLLHTLSESFAWRLYLTTLQHTASQCTTLQQTSQCNILQHTATHCSIPLLCLEIPCEELCDELLLFFQFCTSWQVACQNIPGNTKNTRFLDIWRFFVFYVSVIRWRMALHPKKKSGDKWEVPKFRIAGIISLLEKKY